MSLVSVRFLRVLYFYMLPIRRRRSLLQIFHNTYDALLTAPRSTCSPRTSDRLRLPSTPAISSVRTSRQEYESSPFLSMVPGILSDIPQHFFPRTTSRNGKWVLEWDAEEGEGRSMIMNHSRMASIYLAFGHSSLLGPGSVKEDVFAGDEAAPGPGYRAELG